MGLALLLAAAAVAAPQQFTEAAQPSTHVLCGCQFPGTHSNFGDSPPSDCAYSSNTAGAAYDPDFVMRIPVVWHVVQRSDGTGNLTDQTIIEQMAELNDDFRPASGAPGNDSHIEFVLATEDPMGNPTSGIQRITNDTWFEDSGDYANQLSWNPRRYLNIYTMNTIAIGYVPDIPQGGLVGQPQDGIRMLYTAINSVEFGYVLSHEAGHHLGLLHTFGQGLDCTNTNCQTQGDLICDTNPHRQPSWSCTGNGGNCGGQLVPINNYMNYQVESCVFEFTPGQIQRMRCTLQEWRPLLWETPLLGNAYCAVVPNSTGAPGDLSAAGSDAAGANGVTLGAASLPAGAFGFFLVSQSQGFTQGAGGSAGNLCLGGSIGRFVGPGQIQQADAQGTFSLPLDLTQTPTPQGLVAIQAGETWSFQAWFRDSDLGQPTSNFTNGLEIVFR